jgi:dTDP-4-dehydrorhamnose 3,5-epimerase
MSVTEPPQPKAFQPFVHGEIDGVVVTPLTAHTDERGWLTELYRRDDLDATEVPVMAYLSQTEPGVARGPHEHRDQTDLFVFLGVGQWRLYLWDARPHSPTYGHRRKLDFGQKDRVRIIVPPGVVHAYKNTGDTPGWVFNAANQLYAGEGRNEAVDEIRHEDHRDSPYVLD